jgi:hypothetical protein
VGARGRAFKVVELPMPARPETGSREGVVGLLDDHFTSRTTQVTAAPPQMTTGKPIVTQLGALNQLHTATMSATHVTKPPTSRIVFFIVSLLCRVPP